MHLFVKSHHCGGPVNKSLCDLDGAFFREHSKQRIIDYNITGKVLILTGNLSQKWLDALRFLSWKWQGASQILTGTGKLMKILTIQWATVIGKSYNINHISDWNLSGSVLSTTVLFTDHQYQVQICNIRPLISGRAKNKPTTATTLKRCSVKLISETSFGNILWTFMHPIKHALTLYKR